jgi:muramoyltetrapeptide carboxypeptidase
VLSINYPLRFVVHRRQFLKVLGIAVLGTKLSKSDWSYAHSLQLLKPPRLKKGDTIGLISPANQIQAEEVNSVKDFLSHKGFRVKLGKHIFDQYGYLAGQDEARAEDVNQMFTDQSVRGILTLRGGWGCNRILSLLDYELIRQNPKIIMGYSDITSLLLAISSQTNLVTFHGPVGTSTWNPFTLTHAQSILIDNQMMVFQNSPELPFKTINAGKARGRLWGGNLSVLAAMIGSDYLPDWHQAILFVEDIGEDVYRIDRLLTQLQLAGVLERISGFIFGQCTNCTSGEDGEPSLTLDQVLQDLLKPLGIPAWSGAAFGHVQDKWTLPVGLPVEIDAEQGTIQMLTSALV